MDEITITLPLGDLRAIISALEASHDEFMVHVSGVCNCEDVALSARLQALLDSH